MDDDIGTVRWFGKPWNPEVNDPRAEIPMPVGAVCVQCFKSIEADASGLRIPHLGDRIPDDPHDWEFSHYHLECWLEDILGPAWKELYDASEEYRIENNEHGG